MILALPYWSPLTLSFPILRFRVNQGDGAGGLIHDHSTRWRGLHLLGRAHYAGMRVQGNRVFRRNPQSLEVSHFAAGRKPSENRF